MSPFEAPNRVRRATKWFLVLLCISLIAWRLNSRIEQYHPSSTAATASVAFFDANERNITLRQTSRTPSHQPSQSLYTLPSLQSRQPQLARPIHRNQPPNQPVLPAILIYPATLFSNPPPPIVA